MATVPGFANPDQTVEINDSTEEKVKKKGSKKGGGFQCMGLSYNVLKGITKRGYQQPTPIQRKTIPLVLEGRDVVAMARTGSGKTACFLIPMFEKLKIRSAKAGARALILSPTRELALQTLKFIKELGRFTGLKSAVILGGDSMDDQFSAIHGNPDIIVATPGRFLHVCIEMELKLNSVEYVVFDEADRLFEMGLGEQLTEIVNRLPDARQTVLFSATLPKVLVEFAKAGLNDPVLLRLDVESKIPEELQLWYIIVRPEERLAALLVLLKTHIDNKQQTVVFAATRHHVEYIHMILDRVGVSNTYIYSNLDPSARKINAAKFSTGKVKVLVVTDVAARGIDIPQLDNVINYNFPAKSKLFVHRVGRCARAGRSGTAYSLVTPDEYPYLLDLHLFLGRPLSIKTRTENEGSVGKIPQALLEEQHSALLTLHENNIDLVSMKKVTENAYLQYVRSRPAASSDSNRRVKELAFASCGIHPIFGDYKEYVEEERENLLEKMKSYRPQGTIFEICGKNKSQEYQIMKQKRSFHKEKITSFHQNQEQKENEKQLLNHKDETTLAKSSSEDIDDAFDRVITPKKRKLENLYKRNKKQKTKDENFIPYLPADRHTEEGLAINNFHNEASKVALDLTGDSAETMRKSVQAKKWDRKKKKMVAVPDKRSGKIKTESGVWIPATYKSNRYAQWKEKSKIGQSNSDDENDETGPSGPKLHTEAKTHWARHNKKLQQKQRKSELKTTDQILKARKIAEKKKNRQKKKGKKVKRNK
ncbi:ATP-dependent RNA helicase DDX54 [Tribolium castaneum]|uniref:ATP-dependent RNA helicase DDX54 n=1 Tax=Tribolium castaneum TaxID=7070 RepID=UPI0000D5720F|nr:PREDICTED: ATP-dependent RNA helicase DDX54 [Tribolium castaneum]|eukprot:XP_008198552.1 PREDICTED: ATP-dependent RNA helicase DDX54 [Tribolium castaneum]